MRDPMRNPEETYEVKSYVVRLGHNSVHVDASSDADAILQARQRLAADLPRMWDVIHGLDDSRFRVSLEG